MSQYDHIPPDQQLPESPSIEGNNKLLSFSMPIYNFTLLNYSLQRTSLSLNAQLHGMFFLAESPWTNGEAGPAPAELTCYRRNLFQVTGSVTLPRTLRYIMTDQGDRIPILAQELCILATESVEGNPVKIISVPWKTPAASSTTVVEDKIEKEPPSIPLDTMAGQDMDSDYATFPIQWKRLQFRIATANNGRRKELQQHFVVRLKIMATLSTGAKISICEAHSGPIIVRGRSPRNFQSRKDLPLTNSTSTGRKASHGQQAAPVLNRTSTGESTNAVDGANKADKTVTTTFSYEPNDLAAQQFPDWQFASGQAQNPPPLPTPTFSNPAPVAAYTHSSPEVPRAAELTPRTVGPAAPINLSLMDDDARPPPPQPAVVQPPPAKPKTKQRTTSLSANITSPSTSSFPSKVQKNRITSQASSSKYGGIGGGGASSLAAAVAKQTFGFDAPEDSADQLYEYFPLGLGEWDRPCEAVYRPHVVHHTNVVLDPKEVAARGRSKRYFAEDSG